MRNAHPPLPSILLAAWWKLTGFHILSTRACSCAWSRRRCPAGGLSSCAHPAGRCRRSDGDGADRHLSRVVCANHAGARGYVCRRIHVVGDQLLCRPHRVDRQARRKRNIANAISAGVLFALASLAKETAIVIPAALFLLELWLMWMAHVSRSRAAHLLLVGNDSPGRSNSRTHLPNAIRGTPERLAWLAALAFPALPLARLVPVPPREDRLHVRQSGVSALQRHGKPVRNACAAVTAAQARSPDGASEPVCAGAGDGRGPAAALA